MRPPAALIVSLILAITALAQSEKEGKDLWRKYDKYRDVTIIGTEATDVLAKTANMQTAAALVVAAIVPKDGDISDVAMVFYPDAVSVAGSALQSAARYSAEARDILAGRRERFRNGQVYFQPFAEAILMIGSQRFNLPPAAKEFGLTGEGRFKDSVTVAIPADVFAKLAASPEWSILIGDVALGIGDPDLSKDKRRPADFVKRVQPRLLALRDRIAEINSTAATLPANRPMPIEDRKAIANPEPALVPTPTPKPKTCFENGVKVPCPGTKP